MINFFKIIFHRRQSLENLVETALIMSKCSRFPTGVWYNKETKGGQMDIEQARNELEGRIKALGYRIEYRQGLSGRVRHGAMVCSIPEAKTRKSLYIVCHELFHCLEPRKNKKVYINEMKAEKFAHAEMRRLGFAVPRSQTKRAKGYVSSKLWKAYRRGLKKVDPEVKQFCK